MDLYQFFDGHYSITEVLNHSQKINTASTNSNVCFTKKVLVLWDQSWQWFIKWLYKLYVRFKPRIIDNKTNKQHTWHGGRVFLGTRRKCIRSQKTSIDQVISSDTMPSSTEDVIATTAFLFFWVFKIAAKSGHWGCLMRYVFIRLNVAREMSRSKRLSCDTAEWCLLI